jgi:hypothetical protein
MVLRSRSVGGVVEWWLNSGGMVVEQLLNDCCLSAVAAGEGGNDC